MQDGGCVSDKKYRRHGSAVYKESISKSDFDGTSCVEKNIVLSGLYEAFS